MRLGRALIVCLLSVGSATFFLVGLSWSEVRQAATQPATLFEGARVIVGDASAPIEDSAFLVERSRITRVGRAGEIEPPSGTVRVDLTGKTVMPAMVDLHSHLGFVNEADGSQSKENFTRANLVEHLDRFAYAGNAATVSFGTDFPEFIWQVRRESRVDSFSGSRYLTVGRGLAFPGSGPAHPSRNDVPYAVTTEWQAREAVQKLAAQNADFVKIWVDDRNETQTKISPPIYQAAIEEAHRLGMRAVAHVFDLEDAKGLILAGIEGFTHMVRDQLVDEELLQILEERPDVWFNPNLFGGSGDRTPGERPAWLADPTLDALMCDDQLERWARSEEELTTERSPTGGIAGENTAILQAAGVRLVLGSDAAGGRRTYGWGSHVQLEAFVDWGHMTPHEAIIAATSLPAEILGLDLGMVAVGKSADFLVLDANPLDDILNTRRISHVYLRGREIDRAGMAARWQAACRDAAAE